MTDTQSVPPSLPHHSDSNNHSSVPTTAAPAIPTFPKLHSGPVRTLDNSGYCLLSLDGGGVRGLSTLYILRSIMWRLNSERRKAGLPPKKVCEIFDLIGGTSTGGLIAIMLGRLEMTVEECIDSYVSLMRRVFSKRKHRSLMSLLGKVQPRFSSKALEEAIASVLKDRDVSPDEPFEVNDAGAEPQTGARCKVFVLTKFRRTSTPIRLRSYALPSSASRPLTLTQAALATSAAPTYFSPARVGATELIDGALGANNPALEVEEEARNIWCESSGSLESIIKCFVSVGTGHPGVRGIDGGNGNGSLKALAETLVKEATETERTSQRWLSRWRQGEVEGRVFRFNVRHGLEGVGMHECEEQGRIEEATLGWLEEVGSMREVRRCVENLRGREYEPTPELAKKLNELAAEAAKAETRGMVDKATPAEIEELIQSGNALLKKAPTRLTVRDIQRALHFYSKALHFHRNNGTATSKQIARLCQKLLEASLMLSMAVKDPSEQMVACEQARNYGKAALDNVHNCGDDCMAAQADFLLACAETWKTVLKIRADSDDPRNWQRERDAEVLITEKLSALRMFPQLNMDWYEGQAVRYVEHLDRETSGR